MFIRTVIFKIGLALLTVIYGSISLFFFFLPCHYRYRLLLPWPYLTLKWLKWCCRLDYVIIGKQNIPKQNCIILSKHSSVWETLSLPLIFNIPAIVAKKSLKYIPFFGWMLGMCDPIVIDRRRTSSAMKQVLKQGQQCLVQGRSILLFPEGTRVAPGEKPQYKIGGALLARKARYPILPLAHNAGEFWSNRRFVIEPGVIKVVIGKPVMLSQSNDLVISYQAVCHWIETTVKKIATNDLSNYQ